MSRTIEDIKKELEEMEKKKKEETEEDVGAKVVRLLEEVKLSVKNNRRDLLLITIVSILAILAAIGSIIVPIIR